MNLIKRLLFRLSVKRKQCKNCGKTFYKPIKIWKVRRYYGGHTDIEVKACPHCKCITWIEV